ncbi:sigma-70 family RNA polymerase sigma factor [Parendozoicomonas haliclonae]|uniref:ECF RNA polymerase sigma factor SigE n=1 Tax=Parendozoicomonas haliclonae TaxID=1960125 RepID=A0A1X7AIL0_9GAMM|nr:sigma-70 family RNA polymerase sigma factor [Parendozoicomonas haliclonae]SMA45125.1 ECF RNA polymerase sigma factor SigE [Parendozoicomonas haliclonae]
MNCLMDAWAQNEGWLKRWFISQTGDSNQAEDLLQDLFIKALKTKERFCDLEDAGSWLKVMAKNTAIDSYRRQSREGTTMPLEQEPEITRDEETPWVMELDRCMQRVLLELDAQDRDAIDACDLQGMSQKEYARQRDLSLVAAKSRIQRARQKLRKQMIKKCQIQFDDSGVCGFTPRPE